MAGRSVYERFFPNEPHHFAAFRQVVAHETPPGAVMLDLGCGDNSTFADLRSAGRFVWGTDFQQHPELAEPSAFRLLGAGGQIPFADKTFDAVAAVWVLEHVERPTPFLAEVRRVLKPGGIFHAHTVNANHYVAWVRRMFDLLPHQLTQGVVRRVYGRAEHDTFPTRYRLNTVRQMERTARAAGMEVQRTLHYADQGYFAFSRWATHLATRADYLLDRVGAPGRIYVSVRMRRPFGK